MPLSLPLFDEELELYFRHAAHDSVLDIGPGEGKFGKLLRRVQPTARRLAVEVDAGYVEQYRLRDIYDELLIMDARRLMDDVRLAYGAVIIGDVIEHLPKSAGVDLLHFLVYRSKVIFVKFPVQLAQNDWEGHVSEAHISIWSDVDFALFDSIVVERDPMQMAVIRGYRNNAIEWLPDEFTRALGYASCAAYYDEQPIRWKRADRYSRWLSRAEAALEVLITPGDPFIMVDQEQSGLRALDTQRIPFLERDGCYFGMPATDNDALDELRRQRAAGAKWLIITQDTFWATQLYPGLMRELHTRDHCALQNDGLIVFQLRHD